MKRAPLRRGSSRLRRSWIRRVGRRARRDRNAKRAFEREVFRRAGAVNGWGTCQRLECREWSKLHAHHMKANPRIHDPAFGMALCFSCHILGVHGHQIEDWRNYFA